MLRQASVADLVGERVPRDTSYVVISMRRYPRFVNRGFRDEYLACLSPHWELFEDWLSVKRKHHDHNGAFQSVGFEEKFFLEPEGLHQLRRLSKLAEKKDVYLICQCAPGRRCHRELLLILARRLFRAPAEKPCHDYPIFEKRMKEFRKSLQALPKNAGKITS